MIWIKWLNRKVTYPHDYKSFKQNKGGVLVNIERLTYGPASYLKETVGENNSTIVDSTTPNDKSVTKTRNAEVFRIGMNDWRSRQPIRCDYISQGQR